MQTKCDGCKKDVKEVGRLRHICTRGLSQRLCKVCRKKMGNAYR
jgi:hypothetical protein